MTTYYNYFTIVEERFQERRGTVMLLSTLDWALIDLWRESGIPLRAVLKGIDATFDEHEKLRKLGYVKKNINSLACCAQEVIDAAKEECLGVLDEGCSRE